MRHSRANLSRQSLTPILSPDVFQNRQEGGSVKASPRTRHRHLFGRHSDECNQSSTSIHLVDQVSTLYHHSTLYYALQFPDHVKAQLEASQPQLLKRYTTLMQTVHKYGAIGPHLNKSSAISLRPTYLCLDCSTVFASEQRDQHDKKHILCKSAYAYT